MRIVVNTTSLLSPLTGIGQYTFQVSRKLREVDTANDYTYYYGFFSPELLRKPDQRAADRQPSLEEYKIQAFQKLKDIAKKVPLVRAAGRELRTRYSKTVQMLKTPRFDLYFEPNFIPLEEIKSRRTATMVFDLSAVLHPEWHPRPRVEIFERHFRKGLERSDCVLTATEFVKGQIVEHLKLDASSVFVTPIDCDKQVFRPLDEEALSGRLQGVRVPEDYLMFVGSIEPRKNIMGLLRAFTLLPAAVRRETALLFCGPSGWKNDNVFRFVRENGLDASCRFLPYVTDERLSALYNRARALVYPSFYEGFGLPPLEAMSCGCPVIVSDIPTHREVCGGDAVLYAKPGSPEEIAAAIQRLADDSGLRQTLRDKGLSRAATFSWERTARETLRVFQSL